MSVFWTVISLGLAAGRQGETQGLGHPAKPGHSIARLVHCGLCFRGCGGIARGNWENEGSLHRTEFSGFVCGLNDIPRALWDHPGEKGRCRIMCFLFSVMQLRVAVLDLLRSCVYITQRDVF